MRMYDVIKKKRDGGVLSSEEIRAFVEGYTDGSIPNYLGEILMWWGVAITSLSVLPYAMWSLSLGAIVNTVMFLVVSIPMADRRQARKEGYAAYRAETRSLLPIPKRR